MPTPIPTSYKLYLDPLLGFTPGGTTWQDQSLYEQVYTFNNTGYTYENTIGSFLLPISPATIANQDPPLPGEIGIATSAKTIIMWVKLDYSTAINGDFFTYYAMGRSAQSGVTESRSIIIRVDCVDSGPGGSLVFVPSVLNTQGYRLASFNGSNTTYWQDSNWHMVAYTKPQNGQVQSQKLYVDQGVEITSYIAASSTNIVNVSVNNVPAGLNPRMRINENSGELYPSSIPGSLGQLWIYDEVLTQADIANFYDVTQPRYYPSPAVDKSDGRSFGQGFNG